MGELKAKEHRLREAVTGESCDIIAAAVSDYRRTFDELWRKMPDAERRRSALPLEAAALMRWAQAQLSDIRAALAGRRRSLSAAGRYLRTGRGRPAATWGSAG